jgi:hypothetical protein
MTARKRAKPEPAGWDETGRPVTADEIFADLRRRAAVAEYNDLVVAYNLTVPRNGLLLWMAFHHCRSSGLPVPDTLLERFDELAQAVVHAAQQPKTDSASLARALHLLAGARGATAYRRAMDWRKKVKALTHMNGLIRQDGDKARAAQAVAKTFGYSPGTLLKDYSRFMERPPKSPGDWRTADPWSARLQPLPKKRKAR